MFGTNYSGNNYYLNSEKLFEKVSPIEIYWRYLSFKPENNKKIKCVFHKEKTPSLLIKNNNFKCFGCGKSGNAITFVMELFSCTYSEAVYKICNDFNIHFINNNLHKIENNKIIKINNNEKTYFFHEIRDFNKFDLSYWNDYEINIDDLKFYNINPVKYVLLNNMLLWIELKNNPIYHLEAWNENFISSRYYRPFNILEFGRNKDNKWRGNTNHHSIFGYRELLNLIDNNKLKKDILFITSSLKDVITLYKSNYYAIAPSAETNFISEKQIEYLKTIFKYIYVFFNNDNPGKINSIKYTTKYNLNYINLPDIFIKNKIKDPSDMVKKINRNELNNIIKNKLIRDNVLV